MLGDLLDKLIRTNVELWHQATKIKAGGKPKKDLPSEKRVAIFYKIRELNTRRSKERWNVDKECGGGANETKLRYYGE